MLAEEQISGIVSYICNSGLYNTIRMQADLHFVVLHAALHDSHDLAHTIIFIFNIYQYLSQILGPPGVT